MKTINLIGIGYVGFPTALMLAKAGYKVTGVDVNKKIIQLLNSGKLHIKEKNFEEIFKDKDVRQNFNASEKPSKADIFIIAVPTPVEHDTKKADLSYVKSATESIIPFLEKGNIVVLESTVPPLTCRNILKHIIEKKRDFNVGNDILLAHCPERILPGNILHELIYNDRIIGGYNKKSGDAAKEIYSSFVKGNIYLTDDVTAEFCKLIENAYRDVNIAFANELSLVAEGIGIDINEAVMLANKHPRVNILNHGIGVGGHCIPIDPWFIREVDEKHTTLIKAARDINDRMPYVIFDKIKKAINKSVPSVKEPKIVVIGMAYKPDVDDTRESPALKIIDMLREGGYNVDAYDPFVDGHTYKEISEIVGGADCLVVLVEHSAVKEDLEKNENRIKAKMRNPLIIRF